MKVIVITIAKIIIFFEKLFKRGSVFPGYLAKKMDKNILLKLNLPSCVIAVTGSSGKGSTSSMIATVYRNLGYKVIYNDKGSNQDNAITTTLLENCSLTGKVKSDVVVLEIDERYTKMIFPKISPKYVVITNITRDQPPRQGYVDVVYEDIKKALTKDMHLILNGDDPYIRKFTLDLDCKVTYYSLDMTKYSYNEQLFTNININYCPICHKKLSYNYYHFESTGKYHCIECGFTNPEIAYHITDLDLEKRLLIIDNNYKIKLPNDLLYNAYNIGAAFTTLAINDLDLNRVANILSSIDNDDNKYNKIRHNHHDIYVLNNKNENSTSFNQSLLFTHRFKNTKTIIIGWKEISRRYKYNDISWLYDVDFEILNRSSINKIICVGVNKYDIATRIKYSGIDNSKIVICNDLQETAQIIKDDKNDIFAILNFDYVKPFNDIMEVKK